MKHYVGLDLCSSPIDKRCLAVVYEYKSQSCRSYQCEIDQQIFELRNVERDRLRDTGFLNSTNVTTFQFRLGAFGVGIVAAYASREARHCLVDGRPGAGAARAHCNPLEMLLTCEWIFEVTCGVTSIRSPSLTLS